MFGLSDPVAGHVRAAEALARAAGLDVVEVAHVVAAMCQRPSWLRGQLADAADAAARQILDHLGRGDGGIPAWSPQLREGFERAGGKRGIVEEPRLLVAIVEIRDPIIAAVLEGVGPVPDAPDPLDDRAGELDGKDVVGKPLLAPPRKVEIEVASIRIGPSTPTLDAYGRDLIAEASRGRVRPAFGRDEVFDRIVVTLARHTKPHVILVGEAGVGKTAIAEGLG